MTPDHDDGPGLIAGLIRYVLPLAVILWALIALVTNAVLSVWGAL
ncbi:hypothetical protein NPA31_011770 [Aurantimonas sp. MSK8Z-1]|nr:hypothetical protein [Aurantimonas sp. MSK8Z-1]MCW4115641.1 hypothetical protein [Aurantimonas sp. MSK8Z-1]